MTVEAMQGRAKLEAGLDWSGTFLRLCVPPAPSAADVAPATVTIAPAPAAAAPASPARDTWYAEPAKVFDNLYFIGTRIHNAWALTTSAGIIILDTLWEYADEEEMLGGLKKLGLDQNQVKYVLLSHSHGIGDHDGGAKLFQDRVPGVKLVMAAADWDAMERGQSGYPKGKPKRDLDATDGQKITLGDTTVTIVTTPGHTPGTLSYLFTVKDRGQPVTVAYSGGTALSFGSTPAYYDTYIASAQKMGKAAADAKASVFLSNHSEFDNGYFKAKAVLARGPEDANAFIVGAESVQNYFKMAADCAMAGKLRAAQTKSN